MLKSIKANVIVVEILNWVNIFLQVVRQSQIFMREK